MLIAEKEWDQLLQYIRQSPSRIEMYYQHLLPDYGDEVYTLFAQSLKESLRRATNRREYRLRCSQLELLAKIGGVAYAKDLAHYIRITYPHRPALQDELEKALVN